MSYQKLLKAHSIFKEVRIVLHDFKKEEVIMPLPSMDVFNTIEDFNLPEDIISTCKKENLLQYSGPLTSVRGLQFPIASKPVNEIEEKFNLNKYNDEDFHTLNEYSHRCPSSISEWSNLTRSELNNIETFERESCDMLLDGSDVSESDVESCVSYNSDSEVSDAENMLVDYECNSDTGSIESFRVRAMSRTKKFSTEKQLLARRNKELGKLNASVPGKGIVKRYTSDTFLSFPSVEYDNVINVLTANFENHIITIVTNKVVEFWEKKSDRFLRIGEIERNNILGSVLLTTNSTRTEMWNTDVAVYSELWASSHISENMEQYTNFKIKIFKCEMQKLLCTTIDLGDIDGFLEMADFCFLPDCSIVMAWSKQKPSPADFLGYVSKFYINNTWDQIKKYKMLDALLSKVNSVSCVEGSPSEVIVHAGPLIILYNHEKYTIRTLHINKILEKITSDHLLNVQLYDLYWAEAEESVKTHCITLLFKSNHHMYLISWDKNAKKAERIKQFIVPDVCEGMVGTTVANSLVGCVFNKYIVIWNKNGSTPVCHLELEGDIRACSGSEGIVIFQDSKLKTATLEEIINSNTHIIQ